MKLFFVALIVCGLAGCEAKKIVVPGATIVDVKPK